MSACDILLASCAQGFVYRCLRKLLVLNARFLSFSSEHGHDMHPSKWIRVCAGHRETLKLRTPTSASNWTYPPTRSPANAPMVCEQRLFRVRIYSQELRSNHGLCHLVDQVLLADPPMALTQTLLEKRVEKIMVMFQNPTVYQTIDHKKWKKWTKWTKWKYHHGNMLRWFDMHPNSHPIQNMTSKMSTWKTNTQYHTIKYISLYASPNLFLND